jgi:hypothetical protein
MLVLDPKKRLNENQALSHEWVKGLAAKSDHMEETHNKIKEFNATRKMKVTEVLQVSQCHRNGTHFVIDKRIILFFP